MKVYVIMPYGNSDLELKKEYDKIYRFLIRSAVETYDHTIELVRQDRTGEGGHIVSNVIENLSTGDVVIADISNLNWNVAYELGIRHTLSKSHTILLCNDETDLPFDIQHMNVIIYPRKTWMDDLDEICDRIVHAIQNTMETNRCDSPVHLCFPALPESLTAMLNNNNDAEQQRITELTKKNQQLAEEVDALRKKLENAGLDSTDTDSQAKDLTQLFVQAAKNRNLISDTAVDHLRELESEKKHEEFARFLAEVLKNGYLDETDCRNVYHICNRLGIPEITKQYIQIATSFYPESQELQGYLADVYSNDYREKDRALTLVNDMLGVKRINGKYELTQKVRTDRMLMSFFNVYQHLKKYAELIEIGKLLLKSNPSFSSIILRNIAVSSIDIEQRDLAYAAICRLLHTDPLNDVNHNRLYWCYHRLDEEITAYESLENAICCDSSYTDYYFNLAGHICDELIARTENGVIESISALDKERYVLPFILQAFLLDNTTIERAINFLKKNRMSDPISELIAIYKREKTVEEAFGDVNMDIVNYCYNKKAEILASIEAMPDDFDQYMQ